MKEKYFKSEDKVLHARAAIAVQNKDYESAMEILSSNCFPTYGSLRALLIDLWYDAHVIKAVKENGGKNLTILQTVHLRREMGCDGDAITTTNYKSKCIRGPPNLGYKYG